MAKSEGSRRPFKEKIVQIYEAFFQGKDPSLDNKNFWDEFFLLRANLTFLESKFREMTYEEISSLKETINNLFYHCIRILKDGNQIRAMNSIQTMCALVQGIYGKTHTDYGFDVINLLIGFSSAEHLMQVLIEQLSDFLCHDYPPALKSLVLKFLLILVTATENVSQNMLLEYLMMNSAFEAIIQLLKDTKSRQHHGYDAVLLLTILVNYRKHEAANPYIVKLSIIDNEMALNGFGQVVSLALSDFNRKFCQEEIEPRSSFLSSITTFVESMFVSEESESDRFNIKANNAVLLALYEAVHLNRNFLITLTHCQMDGSGPFTSPSQMELLDIKNSALQVESDLPPSNLLVTFLEFSSIIMLNTRDESNMNTCKLCFIILTCITEDQYANSIIHDVNLVYKVHLHRMPMRHRKVASGRNSPYRPLACPLLDLMVEFILSHMTKCLPFELYYLCLGVIHRILCHQKKSRVRLQYNWKELWTALISLVKFLITQESLLAKNCNIFHLSIQVMNVLNLFITFGDTFLPSPSCYDELYYEIVRMNYVFDNLYSLTLKYSTCDGEWKEFAAKLMNSLVNIRAIINHFTPKIDSVLADNGLSALTEDQVLDVVRSNYDTLTLKLYDNLDQYERYTEKPIETAFFTPLVRSVISEFRKSSSLKSLKLQNVLKEFSSIV
ncbi:armadillo-like helical domain-containing protein 3 [Stegodyphus dumicola]|uniref:armadillo-like helical domain-containing protein 3 n=1 Tax=Stegodyphus dumicola TaxID=202533 RepID=UPI0015A7D155|nr:armadillo-like helical domain-containing protein 3 [Stegodyphus dumicola]XP_035216621.1 armadillo-like helical domain-containing protein 3 [Stegodyphus dumicola]